MGFVHLAPLLGTMSTTQLFFLLGILTHLLYFRHGEWDLYAFHLLISFCSAQILLAAYFVACEGIAYAQAWSFSIKVSIFFLSGVYISLLTYRAAFHRLNRFPGPLAARLSNLYITILSVKRFQRHREIMRLHKRYGDIVRVGPSELSINDPALFHSIHSKSSTFTKGPWYNLMHPVVSLHMIRDHEEHSRRRKIWDKGFSSKALREYEPRVALYTEQLLKRIVCSGNQTVNVTALFNYYSFDVMGDLAFGRSFNMLRDGAAHKYMKSSHDNMLTATAFSHLVWIFPIVKKIPGLNYEHVRLQKWLTEQVEQRRQSPPTTPDIFSWLLNGFENLDCPTPQDEVNLVGDAHLVVVAGSDLTAASITCLFYQLALHPRIMAKLVTEIDQFYTKYEHPSHQGLSKLEYLNACIDESLRLYPPVPSGLQRISSPQGCHVGDLYIPGNTIVQIPSYAMYRDAKNFTLPNDFIPERWTTRPELTRDSSIYAPFSIGSYSCVGKQLGLMELRFVTSQILKHFNVNLPNDFDPNQFPDGVKDGLTIVAPDLNLAFTRRHC